MSKCLLIPYNVDCFLDFPSKDELTVSVENTYLSYLMWGLCFTGAQSASWHKMAMWLDAGLECILFSCWTGPLPLHFSGVQPPTLKKGLPVVCSSCFPGLFFD